MMKIFFCMMSFLSVTALHSQGVDSNFHLYLLIGQSNMAGRGPVDAESKQTHEL
jgi:hypothetical protein